MTDHHSFIHLYVPVMCQALWVGLGVEWRIRYTLLSSGRVCSVQRGISRERIDKNKYVIANLFDGEKKQDGVKVPPVKGFKFLRNLEYSLLRHKGLAQGT